MKKNKLFYVIVAIALIAAFLFVRNSSDAGKDFTDSLISTAIGEPVSDSPSSGTSSLTILDEEPEEPEPVAEAEAPAEEPAEEPAVEESEEETPVEEPEELAEPAEEEPEEALPDEDGVYDSKEEVALYLHLYHHLPSNYITKNDAKSKGWSGNGSDKLDKYCPGMCIGGDYFGNYEGVLPKGKYHECDIDTLGAKSRGAKRIVFSDDWHIYYTEDHYETFELLYEP